MKIKILMSLMGSRYNKDSDDGIIRSDMFYDICGSSGWSRIEVEEMELLPEELELDEWTTEEFLKWVSKWFMKTTGYYVEYKEGEGFVFKNAVLVQLANMGVIPVSDDAKKTVEELGENTHTIPVDNIEKTLAWGMDKIVSNFRDVPDMKKPENRPMII